MENLFMNALKNATNIKETENGAVAHKSTNSAVYDLFAFGGAYRSRRDEDCILLFKNAYEENPTLAVKCLFYLRDARGGQGERRFFRLAFNWLANNYQLHAKDLLGYLPEYGRYDDLWYATENTPLFKDVINIIKTQLMLDLDSKTPSLLAKWLPSENTSSYDTRKMANKIVNELQISHKQYRKYLSLLREKIRVVEKLMSENRWNEIEFDKIPSKAGLIYKNAFARRDLIAKKYKNFIESEDTKVNAKVLYPYEIVSRVSDSIDWWSDQPKLTDLDKKVLEKYWENLPNYFEGGRNQNILCVVDTSGSMTTHDKKTVRPIDVAISLGMYAGERCTGPFKDHYISFSAQPKLIQIEGIDFVDKVTRIYRQNLCENTNLTGVFDMLKEVALSTPGAAADLPSTIVVISDMEIDSGARGYTGYYSSNTFESWTTENAATEMEKIRQEWAAAGLRLPNLVYWNVSARNNTILDSGDSVSFVSGCSPVIFQQVVKGVKGIELMMEILESDRYKDIK